MPKPTANLPIVSNTVSAEARDASINAALSEVWDAAVVAQMGTPEQEALVDEFRGLRDGTLTAAASADADAGRAEAARDLAETYAGVNHRAATWAALEAINGTAGQVGYVPDEDAGTHTDPITSALVPNSGVYVWADDGLGSAEAERVGGTGLAAKAPLQSVLQPIDTARPSGWIDPFFSRLQIGESAAGRIRWSGDVSQLSIADSLTFPGRKALRTTNNASTLGGAVIWLDEVGAAPGDTVTVKMLVTGTGVTARASLLARNEAGQQQGSAVLFGSTGGQSTITPTGIATLMQVEYVVPAGTAYLITRGIVFSGTGHMQIEALWGGKGAIAQIPDWPIWREDSAVALAVKDLFLARDGLTINAGRRYPLRNMVRDAQSIAENTIWSNLLLSMEVIGALPGKVYGIRYQRNGAAVSGPSEYAWRIEEYDAADYATDSAASLRQVVRLSDPAPDIDPAGGVQTIEVTSVVQPGLKFRIVVQPSALPAYGTAVRSDSSARAGWSDIIDPSCYRASDEAPAGIGPLWVVADGDAQMVSIAWQHGADKLMRVSVASTTVNGLPTIEEEAIADITDPRQAVWATIAASGGGDYWPPLVVSAVSGGDGSSTAYTGGNHGANGDSTGGPTAELTDWQCWVDGAPVGAGRISAFAEGVTMRWSALVEGFNTRGDRAIVRQDFAAYITPGSIETACTVTALESVTVAVDNGPQVRTQGWQNWLHFWGGQQSGKIDDFATGATSYDSGPSDTWPTARIMAVAGAHGVKASWLDAGYGAGDGVHVAASDPFMRHNGSSDKTYHAVVTSGASVTLAAGESYRWRGGWTWTPAASGDIEAWIRRTIGRRVQYVAMLPAGGAGVVPVIGADVAAADVDADGLRLSRAGYGIAAADIGA